MSAFFPVDPERGKSILQRQSQALLLNGHLERVRQLRNLAIATELDCPKYLLSPEVNQLLQCIPDLHQRTLIDTLWNTGALFRFLMMIIRHYSSDYLIKCLTRNKSVFQ
ncbi:hypothetical protein [Providencia manganoxydans]|uniref:hypothetical protein n=1 Tax=Providencia manganoxydans TaxID=2923283 RepID=UPI003F72636A